MIDKPATWTEEIPIQAFLAAFDISGFSKDPNPDVLLKHRWRFIRTVEESPFFKAQLKLASAKVHFLGDELRVAVPATTDPSDVLAFATDVLKTLAMRAESEATASPTRVRGVLLAGTVVWRRWHDCEYLAGELPLKAQDWLGYLTQNQLAFDAAFKQYFDVDGLYADLTERELGGEAAFTLTVVQEP